MPPFWVAAPLSLAQDCQACCSPWPDYGCRVPEWWQPEILIMRLQVSLAVRLCACAVSGMMSIWRSGFGALAARVQAIDLQVHDEHLKCHHPETQQVLP